MPTTACGHEPSPHAEHTTGTAHRPDGTEICWDCALAEERQAMRTVPAMFAYLSGDGQSVTTWTGGLLMRVTGAWTRPVGFGRRPSRTYLRARDVHGAEWYGTSPGRGMYARMKRRCRNSKP